ncbi:hypothetical protein SISSUDRAFT_390555 [Sistotremastrum suecicum HHB10207 ss-3]|uniref:Uncharacterized protein n=1 Tax=Sistotremastrum suecicum HHB10207 ss-3 TaxID=1314776 RepID=A0A165YWA0_9AGAM|nr:hypothetical protein SISSUDRAFT_390555 [Sistotremastrum suecicum HHB10207 ss-3]
MSVIHSTRSNADIHTSFELPVSARLVFLGFGLATHLLPAEAPVYCNKPDRRLYAPSEITEFEFSTQTPVVQLSWSRHPSFPQILLRMVPSRSHSAHFLMEIAVTFFFLIYCIFPSW